MDQRWLQRHQIGVYALAVGAAAGIGLTRPDTASALERLINPVLAVLLYVTFLEIPLVELRNSLTNRRFMAGALAVNFLVVPVVVFGLARVLPDDPVILVGVYMVLLTPCIDYVIAFTDMAGGDAGQLTATTPVLMFVQLLLLPAYLWAFMGREIAAAIEPGPFLEAFLFLIAGPLTLAWLTQLWGRRADAGHRWEELMGWLPVPMMGATLLVVIASQLPRVRDSLEQIAVVVPVYVAFLCLMPVLGRLAATALRLPDGESRALVFTSVTRNSLVVLPLALALPAEYAIVPSVVVTQTLVELTGLLVLTRLVTSRVWERSETMLRNVGSQ
ncbi:arsenic resistance protein [Halostagnicola kamekurae]|uniref:Arsenite efflux pump ArsB, ACR3 family n=1 Tax=Halostagnicola kamekurae TaxID=619731 RepID=A0A1I6QLG4_9EURY|nr:bile acid:sodium symporter [Halostagnicola kamekurae]SFS53202.1 Arsenite efflux pump ArsB, ACR3 family [Halostagnicola kamekurae]